MNTTTAFIFYVVYIILIFAFFLEHLKANKATKTLRYLENVQETFMASFRKQEQMICNLSSQLWNMEKANINLSKERDDLYEKLKAK